MEKRLILAMVLSILVLFLYQAIFIKPSQQPKPELPQPEKPAAETQAPEPEEPAALEKKPPETALPNVPGAIMASQEQEIEVRTSLYVAKWSNRGGVLRSWRLSRYLDETNQGLELVNPFAQQAGLFPFSLRLDDKALETAVNQAYFQPSAASLSLEKRDQAELIFEYSDGKSVFVRKRFIFRGDAYDFRTEISVVQDGVEADYRVVWGPGIGHHLAGKGKPVVSGAGGVALYQPPKVIRLAERKLKEEALEMSGLAWAAYEDNYTAALFVFPQSKGKAAFRKEVIQVGEGTPVEVFFLEVSSPELGRIGPKEIDDLKAFGYDGKKLINFGFFGAIVEILLLGLKAFYRLIPNWGVAIILLTLVIKIIFFPLTYSSTKSMARMQELQPKIKALQAKYKKAKRDIEERRKMNEEMMKLYKEHGINPAAGCLPILIQFPVFIAFYRLLVIAIELRRSPFLLWVKDLSTRDPYYILPILMGITQYISQRMVPTSADPTQKRLTLIMPVFMTIIFLNFQSGLVLYWLTNNVLQIIQQYIMNRLMRRKKSQAHGKKPKK